MNGSINHRFPRAAQRLRSELSCHSFRGFLHLALTSPSQHPCRSQDFRFRNRCICRNDCTGNPTSSLRQIAPDSKERFPYTESWRHSGGHSRTTQAHAELSHASEEPPKAWQRHVPKRVHESVLGCAKACARERADQVCLHRHVRPHNGHKRYFSETSRKVCTLLAHSLHTFPFSEIKKKQARNF